ncbi:MAG: hypothetical protein ACYS29_10690, partial [Planctomycetota bacterium]
RQRSSQLAGKCPHARRRQLVPARQNLLPGKGCAFRFAQPSEMLTLLSMQAIMVLKEFDGAGCSLTLRIPAETVALWGLAL